MESTHARPDGTWVNAKPMRHDQTESSTEMANSERTRPGRSFRFWAMSVSLLVATAVFGAWLVADSRRSLPDDLEATYVGRQVCAECHGSETKQWEGSDHDRAMDVATDETVLGDFNDAELTHHGITSRMFRKDGGFMIHTEGPDGKMADFEIKYVFGVRPLQQFMVEFDRPADMPENEIARLQVLRISWDTEKKRWFYMPPPDVSDKLAPTDDLHWTGVAQCWNNMCAYCHSTDLKKNFDVETRVYHTTFSEIDVSCETCHGPGSVHVELARRWSFFWDSKRGHGLVRLKTDDTRPEIQSCAPCHSRRRMLYHDFLPGDNYYDFFSNELLAETTYHADGQIMDEDYVFGSFIQSKMYHNNIRCSDCHNPHSLRLKHDGNKVCTSCHQHSPAKYDTPAHHHHEVDSTGALCAECHMPETTYMEVDPRRDHSIRIPRPDLSTALGLPNACTRCHLTDAKIPDQRRAELHQYRDWIEAARGGDKLIRSELERLDQWMLESVDKWYGKKEWPRHFAYALTAGRKDEPGAADALARVALDKTWPGIVRATAIYQRGLLADQPDLGVEVRALRDEDPQVRAAAVDRFFERIPNVGSGMLPERQLRTLEQQLGPLVSRLVPLLDDPRRNVRAETGRVLARVPRQLINAMLNGDQREKRDMAINDYIAGVNESNDRGGAHMALGVLYESLGWDEKAEQAYRTAIHVEPTLTGPRSNLAALLEKILEQEVLRQLPAQVRRQLPEGFLGNLSETDKEQLKRWLDDRLLTRITQCQREVRQLRRGELKLLARDASLLPDSAALQYRYGLALYLQGQVEEAEKTLRNACRLEPRNEQFLFALALFYQKYQRADDFVDALDRLIKMNPSNPQYRQLRQQFEQQRKKQLDPSKR